MAVGRWAAAHADRCTAGQASCMCGLGWAHQEVFQQSVRIWRRCPCLGQMHPHCNAPEVPHATALVQQGLKPRISTSFSSADMRSWRSERSKISSFATSPLRVQLPASANPPTTLPNHPHARKPNPLKAGARARRNHRLPGLDEGASAAPMASVLDETPPGVDPLMGRAR